ncbi:MAG: hypothetical protein ACK59M_05855 [Pseudomonadota bacterium]|jgi:hypothetical protein
MSSVGTAILALDDPEQESLSRVALLASGWSVRVFRREERRLDDLQALSPASGRGAMVLLDLRRATQLGLRFDAALRLLKARLPQAAVVIALSDRERASVLANAWATANGAQAVVGRIVRHRLRETSVPLLRAAGSTFDAERVTHYATALLGRLDSPAADVAEVAIAAAEAVGADLDGLARSLADGAVAVTDRRWRMTTYPLCFTGADATSWIARRLGVARPQAEQVGRALQVRGALYHVVGEQPFRDGEFFFRSTLPSQRAQDIGFAAALEAVAGPGGPVVANRTWRGLSFPRCFVGEEAATAIGRAFRLDFAQAVGVLRAMLELHVFRHVADEHDFYGTGLFYRFGHDAGTA